jgi:oligopeptide/dipeptide ABC transporter ATP-binding protein
MTVGAILGEPLALHRLAPRREIRERVASLLELVGLPPAYAARYPHEFSGGQRQRIGIARALAVGPRLIVGDEPVSALDVSVQAQIINLLQDLQDRLGLTYIVIAHDLTVVKHMSDRVAVMYLGRIVESAPTAELFREPRHPYTQALLSAIPLPDPSPRQRPRLLEGDVPNPADPPPGCHLQTRCPHVRERCRSEVPALADSGDGHAVACHFWRELPSVAALLARHQSVPAYQARLDAMARRRAAASPAP